MKIFICFLIFLNIFIVSCDGPPLPPDIHQLTKFDIVHRNSFRTDSLSMYPKIHYRGRVQHLGGEIKQLDTTFSDGIFRNNFFNGISDSVFWNTVGNLPDPNDSFPDFYTISFEILSGRKHTFEFSQKIPEIESTRSRFEQIYLKFLP